MSNIQAAGLPVGNCVQLSIWQKIGAVWKPVAPTVSGNCTAALRFLNGSGPPFIVQPPDDNQEFGRLHDGFPDDNIVWGLDAAAKAALEAKFHGAVLAVLGQSVPTFSLPMVPFGTDLVDLTPLDDSGSQKPPG